MYLSTPKFCIKYYLTINLTQKSKNYYNFKTNNSLNNLI